MGRGDLLANRGMDPFEHTFNIELIVLGVKIVRWIRKQSGLIVMVLIWLVNTRIDRAEIVLQGQVQTMLVVFVVHLRLNRDQMSLLYSVTEFIVLLRS